MSQIILDEQLAIPDVLEHVKNWIGAARLQELRPNQVIRDDRVPEVLLTLKRPTFVTIDQGFYKRKWCHPRYCILYFALREDQQVLLPALLRALLRQPRFRTRAARMGKVARVSPVLIDYWQCGSAERTRIEWATT